MKTLFNKWVIVVFILVAFTECNNVKKEKEVVKIGAILPLTGPASYIGESIYNGIKLAEEQNYPKINVIYEDCQADPKKAVSILKKLQNEDVKIFIPTFSGVTNAISPLSVSPKELLFATSVSASNITKQNNNLYRLFVHANGDADILASYAIDSLKITKIGIIFINDDFGKDYLDVFKTQIIKQGGKIITEIPYDKSETDFKNIILKAKSKNECEAYYLLGYDKNLVQLLMNYHTYQINKPILSIATIGQKNILDQVANIINELPPIYYTTTEFASNFKTSPLKDKFIVSYKDRFGKEPDYFAAFSFDLVNIIAAAQKNSADDIKEYISQNTFLGVMGSIEFDDKRDANIKMLIEKLN